MDDFVAFVVLLAMILTIEIDHRAFVAALADEFPEPRRSKAFGFGMGMALSFKLLLLVGVDYISRSTGLAFSLFGYEYSWRDVVLVAGGLFLIWWAIEKFRRNIAFDPSLGLFGPARPAHGYAAVVGRLLVFNLMISMLAAFVAVGLTNNFTIMVVVVLIAFSIAAYCAPGPSVNSWDKFIAEFVTTLFPPRLFAALFILAGMAITVEGFGFLIPKSYIHAGIAFLIFVVGLVRLSRRS